jgi:hypothetical protein
MRPPKRQNRPRRTLLLTLAVLLIGGVLLAGCGSSSKPAYCDPVSKAENAIKSLPSLQDITNGGVGTLKSAVTDLQQKTTNAVNQAKGDFSTQTMALENAVNALADTIKGLAGSPNAATLAVIPGQVTAVKDAVNNLQNAVSSKCG